MTGLLFVAPLIWSVVLSLTSATLIGTRGKQPDIIGLANYREFLAHPDSGILIRNTLALIVFAGAIGAAGIGLVTALIIDRALRRGSRLGDVAFVCVIAAGVTPPLLVGAMWARLLDFRAGLLNAVANRAGLGPYDLLGEAPLTALILAESWRGAALPMLIFLAAARSVPDVLYEAAAVDRLPIRRQLTGITLPALGGVAPIAFAMSCLMMAGSFVVDLALTSGGAGRRSETLAFHAYVTAFSTFRIGYGAALAVMILVLAAIAVVSPFLVRRWLR